MKLYFLTVLVILTVSPAVLCWHSSNINKQHEDAVAALNAQNKANQQKAAANDKLKKIDGAPSSGISRTDTNDTIDPIKSPEIPPTKKCVKQAKVCSLKSTRNTYSSLSVNAVNCDNSTVTANGELIGTPSAIYKLTFIHGPRFEMSGLTLTLPNGRVGRSSFQITDLKYPLNRILIRKSTDRNSDTCTIMA